MYNRIILLLSLALCAGQASATLVNTTGANGEATLQQVLDGITVGGHSSVDVNNDQVAPDEVWSLGATGGAMSQIVIELAGYAPINSFGIYDAANPTRKVQVFSGAQQAGDKSVLFIDSDGSVWGLLGGVFGDSGVDFASNLFGFYLQTQFGPGQTQTWYSQTTLNSDQADHMVAYAGKNDAVTLPNSFTGTWDPNEFVLAWEDLARPGWDYDYNDFVVMVESVHANVPEPGSLALFGVGLAALGWTLRRRTVSIKG